MKRFLISAGIVIAFLIGGFFLLNHYIYWEKQADAPSDTEQPIDAPAFEWSYRDFEDKDIPYTEITLTAFYDNGPAVARTIDTIEGNCNVFEEADGDVYERSTMIICYYAGFGRYYKVVESGEEYLVQRREFEEASPDYNPPQQSFRTIERFES